MSLFDTGIRPAIDAWLLKKGEEKRDYGDYWSASSAGYCMRRNIFERLKVPYTSENARKQRVFAVGDVFHKFMQDITKEAGLSIAQELELQDEKLMIRGHIDDLVLVQIGTKELPEGDPYLILYDYKSVSSRSFTYQKNRPMSHYHRLQLATYMYMLRNWTKQKVLHGQFKDMQAGIRVEDLTEARILKISKDDLRMVEEQLMWSAALEKEVVGYWTTLNGYWKNKKMPKCTCADYEGGFLAREAYNNYFYQDEPCSLAWMKKWKEENGLVQTRANEDA